MGHQDPFPYQRQRVFGIQVPTCAHNQSHVTGPQQLYDEPTTSILWTGLMSSLDKCIRWSGDIGAVGGWVHACCQERERGEKGSKHVAQTVTCSRECSVPWREAVAE